jgi:hypothetical protein
MAPKRVQDSKSAHQNPTSARGLMAAGDASDGHRQSPDVGLTRSPFAQQLLQLCQCD